MKALITYYSYSGITEKVVGIFADLLKNKGQATIQRLKPKKEITSFLGQAKAAFLRERAELDDAGIQYDSSPYDLVIIALPVWAFAPVPAFNTYLDKVTGLTAKRVIIVLTSGSGAGVTKCFADIRNVLLNKGVSTINEINVPNRIMGDTSTVMAKLSNIL